MAVQFSPEQLTRLRNAAEILERQAAANEHQAQQLLASAEQDLREVLADAPDVIPEAFRNYSTKTSTGIGRMRELCLSSREHHLATVRMISDFGERRAGPSGGQSLAHAVLVVDDYADSRECLSMVLQNAGFIVRTASDGLEALLAAHQLQPAVILMDLMMPVLDGVEATRLIKAHPELRHVHVIAYIATPRPPQPELFSAVLQKPSPPDMLIASVNRFLGSGDNAVQE